MKAYAIILMGQGDTDIKIVNKETFDWVTSKHLGRQNNESSWDDKSCPLNVRQQMWSDMSTAEQASYGAFENFYPNITIGSPDNDRALLAPAIKQQDGSDMSFWDMQTFMAYTSKHGIAIENTYEGFIY